MVSPRALDAPQRRGHTMLGWLYHWLGSQNVPSAPIGTETGARVIHDDSRILLMSPDGHQEIVLWSSLERVTIETTDAGPSSAISSGFSTLPKGDHTRYRWAAPARQSFCPRCSTAFTALTTWRSSRPWGRPRLPGSRSGPGPNSLWATHPGRTPSVPATAPCLGLGGRAMLPFRTRPHDTGRG